MTPPILVRLASSVLACAATSAGRLPLHQGCKLVLHRIHFLMACEAMLHPLHGKKRELVLGAQGGHERGTLADARIVHRR